MAKNLNLPFADVRLYGDDIVTGTAGGPEFSTDVTINHGGHEQRNANWDMPLGRWDIGQRGYCQSTKDYLITFFRQRRGKFQGFLWRDLADWQATADPVSSEQGFLTQGLVVFEPGSNVGQLVKRYYNDNSFAADRIIVKPVISSVVGLLPGMTLGQLGKVTNTGATVAQVEVDFNFDVPVRFDTDHLRYNLQSTEAKPGTPEFESIYYVDTLPIVEQRASDRLIDTSGGGGGGGNLTPALAWSSVPGDINSQFSPGNFGSYTTDNSGNARLYFKVVGLPTSAPFVFIGYTGSAVGVWGYSYDAVANIGFVDCSFSTSGYAAPGFLVLTLFLAGVDSGSISCAVPDSGLYPPFQWIAYSP
jgi:uncharacterized protein (TIGR02217 family)